MKDIMIVLILICVITYFLANTKETCSLKYYRNLIYLFGIFATVFVYKHIKKNCEHENNVHAVTDKLN